MVFNTLKSEVLRTIRKNYKIGGFAPTAKALVFYTPKSEVLRTIRKNSKIGGFATTATTPKSEVLHSFKNIINNI